ncbi:MAG: DUF2085 domain-containing protein [Anaerolineaceae bacterium]|nr:DUF2085 domain-containing protein [Anaerolineaceae bacterium]
MIQALLFVKKDDPRTTGIEGMLGNLAGDFPHEYHVIEIDRDPVLLREFGEKSPVLDIGVFRLIYPFDEGDIRYGFDKAINRLEEAKQKGNDVTVNRITQPLQMNKSDRFSRWFSNHYMVLLNLFTFLYLFFAFLAPVLMKVGATAPAKVIYKVYSPLCHQLAFRSFFLFGEQPYYPRELAGVEGVITYGEATGLNEYDLDAARDFLGNEVMGYKLALCERDIAIYGALFLFGVLFALTGKKIKPLTWYLWIIIGLGPIGLDGFSQLLSQTGWGVFSWLPLRESTPLLRALTGAFFGLGTAWFGFPYLEDSVQENRRDMQMKYAIVSQIEADSQD